MGYAARYRALADDRTTNREEQSVATRRPDGARHPRSHLRPDDLGVPRELGIGPTRRCQAFSEARSALREGSPPSDASRCSFRADNIHLGWFQRGDTCGVGAFRASPCFASQGRRDVDCHGIRLRGRQPARRGGGSALQEIAAHVAARGYQLLLHDGVWASGSSPGRRRRPRGGRPCSRLMTFPRGPWPYMPSKK
jgi:hypothetical protein